MLILFKNFRVVDECTDRRASVLAEDGVIRDILPPDGQADAGLVIDGKCFGGAAALMPAFVDLHAHFRDPGFYGGEDLTGARAKETLESACLAAAAGGYGAVACMANTRPPIDSIEKAALLKSRCDALGLIDLYPVLSLTKNMEGKELSEITGLNPGASSETGTPGTADFIRMVSEDGRDVADDGIFLAAFAEARRAGVPVSCHCDLDGEDAATGRAIELAAKAGARVHIAHVSTGKSIALIKAKKAALGQGNAPFSLSCEITPHHLALTAVEAAAFGAESFGKVAPPLRAEADRQALIAAAADGTADAIATDHAPHTQADKAEGAPGFTGLETAFAVCYSTLVEPGRISLSRLSSLMSAAPARILGLDKSAPGAVRRGRIAPGHKADLCIADLSGVWTVEPEAFKSRGKNSPFAGRKLLGRITMTLHGGRIVYDRSAKDR
jgi:dihydroorotase